MGREVGRERMSKDAREVMMCRFLRFTFKVSEDGIGDGDGEGGGEREDVKGCTGVLLCRFLRFTFFR